MHNSIVSGMGGCDGQELLLIISECGYENDKNSKGGLM